MHIDKWVTLLTCAYIYKQTNQKEKKGTKLFSAFAMVMQRLVLSCGILSTELELSCYTQEAKYIPT